MKVYVVYDRDYDSFDIRQVFLNEEDADAYCRANDCAWEEFEVQESPVIQKKKYYLWWYPYLRDNDKGPWQRVNPAISHATADYTGNGETRAEWVGSPPGTDHLAVTGWSREDVVNVYQAIRAEREASLCTSSL